MKKVYSIVISFFCFLLSYYTASATPFVHTTQLGYEISYTKSLSEGCNVTIKKNGVSILTNQSMGAICSIDTTGMVGIYSHGPAYQIYEAADGYTYILFNSSHFVFHTPYSRYSRGSASLLILKPEGTTKFIEIFTEISGSTNIPTFKYTFSAGGQLGIYYSLFSGTLNKFFQLNSTKDAFEDTTIYWNHHSMSPLWGDSIIQEPLTYTFSPLPTPTNLTQFIEMPDPENSEGDVGIIDYKLKREKIGSGKELGYKIGHFQSGSGVILTASVDTGGQSGYSVYAEVFASGSTNPVFTDEKPVDPNTGSGEILVPITSLPAGEYRWTMRAKKDGGESEIIEYGENPSDGTDFAIFDGFEPYPYGYRFENNSPVDGLLYGQVGYNFPNTNPLFGPLQNFSRIKVPGNKWNIFEKAFDTSNLTETEKFAAFESRGLNAINPDIFKYGSCYGLSLSSVMTQSNRRFLNTLYPEFYQKVRAGDIWHSIIPFSNSGGTNWSQYTPELEDIFAMQISQHSTVGQKSQ